MFGINKKKEKIQSLEAKVRGLVEENQQLQVERNEQRLRADSYRKACEMIFTSHQRVLKTMSETDGLEIESPAEELVEVDCDSCDDLPFKINN